MNQFCLDFIRLAWTLTTTGKVAIAKTEEKERFIDSLIECHQNGLYLAFGKTNGWKLSNKNPDKLAQQIKDRQHLINTLFQTQ